MLAIPETLLSGVSLVTCKMWKVAAIEKAEGKFILEAFLPPITSTETSASGVGVFLACYLL